MHIGFKCVFGIVILRTQSWFFFMFNESHHRESILCRAHFVIPCCIDKMPPLSLLPPISAISQVLSFQTIFTATWQKYWKWEMLAEELLMQFFILKPQK